MKCKLTRFLNGFIPILDFIQENKKLWNNVHVLASHAVLHALQFLCDWIEARKQIPKSMSLNSNLNQCKAWHQPPPMFLKAWLMRLILQLKISLSLALQCKLAGHQLVNKINSQFVKLMWFLRAARFHASPSVFFESPQCLLALLEYIYSLFHR